jgi:hypothetical protein
MGVEDRHDLIPEDITDRDDLSRGVSMSRSQPTLVILKSWASRMCPLTGPSPGAPGRVQ